MQRKAPRIFLEFVIFNFAFVLPMLIFFREDISGLLKMEDGLLRLSALYLFMIVGFMVFLKLPGGALSKASPELTQRVLKWDWIFLRLVMVGALVWSLLNGRQLLAILFSIVLVFSIIEGLLASTTIKKNGQREDVEDN